MQDPTLPNEKNESINLASLTPQQMATILAKASGVTIDVCQIEEDIKAGAPVDQDGNLNILSYAAWLAKDAQAMGH
jgi:hypothetical protein